jgi:hypothetical protein
VPDGTPTLSGSTSTASMKSRYQVSNQATLSVAKSGLKGVHGTFAAFAREIIHNILKKTQRSDI